MPTTEPTTHRPKRMGRNPFQARQSKASVSVKRGKAAEKASTTRLKSPVAEASGPKGAATLKKERRKAPRKKIRKPTAAARGRTATRTRRTAEPRSRVDRAAKWLVADVPAEALTWGLKVYCLATELRNERRNRR